MVIHDIEQEEQKVLAAIKNKKGGMETCGRMKSLVDEHYTSSKSGEVKHKIGKDAVREEPQTKKERSEKK